MAVATPPKETVSWSDTDVLPASRELLRITHLRTGRTLMAIQKTQESLNSSLRAIDRTRKSIDRSDTLIAQLNYDWGTFVSPEPGPG